MLTDIITIFAKMTWQDWATAAGFVTGLVGVVAFLDQRRGAKQTANLVELARRHVDKSITEEDLSRLSQQREAIQTQIAGELPALARRAVLREQFNLHAKAAAEHFTRLEELRSQLSTSAELLTLDPAVARAIERDLLPSYVEQKARETMRTRVTIYSVGTALAGSILPNPMSALVVAAFSVPLATAILRSYP